MDSALQENKKICNICKNEKFLKDFSKSKYYSDGYRSQCKQCNKDYRQKNIVKIKQKAKEYYAHNRERSLEKSKKNYKKYYGKYPDRFLLKAAKARAKKSGLDFNLTLEDISIPDLCPVLKIPLRRNTEKNNTASHNSPSLDRINPNLGYIKGNVRVISHRANSLKSNACMEELELLLEDARRLKIK
jgi:hypothetical protein